VICGVVGTGDPPPDSRASDKTLGEFGRHFECLTRAGEAQTGHYRDQEVNDMGVMAKFRNNLKIGKGRAKARYGRATGRPGVEAKGHAERARGGLGRITEQSKDDHKNARRKLKK
jgi:uncharacterized protein YjbJ (UPF0337 family)